MSTIWHAGSTTLHAGLKTGPDSAIDWTHCGPKALEKAESGAFDMIATTCRDPFRIAASWANRDEIDLDRWREQWHHWHLLARMPRAKIFLMPGPNRQHGYPIVGKLNPAVDKYQLHAALESSDWDSYYSAIPSGMIDFAVPLFADIQRAL